MMKITSCPRCSSAYASIGRTGKIQHTRQPLVLKCGHTFCETCVSQLLRKAESNENPSGANNFSVLCSICKGTTFLRNGAKDLMPNFYLSAFISHSQQSKLDHELGRFVPASHKKTLQKSLDDSANQFKCKMCLHKNATCKCVECDSILCSSCFQRVHEVSAAIKCHKPVAFSAQKKPMKKRQQLETVCTEHNRPIEYLCEDDDSLICSRCYIGGCHKNHNIQSFEEKNKALLGDLETAMETAIIVVNKLKKADKKIHSAMPNFKTETKDIVEKVNQSFFAMHSQLQAREMAIMDTIYSAFEETYINLEKQKISFNEQRQAVEGSLREARKLLEDSSLVIDGNALLSELKEAASIPCVIKERDDGEKGSIEWQETLEEDLTDMINMFGSITGKPERKIVFRTIEEEPGEVLEEERVSLFRYHSTSSQLSSADSVHDITSSVGTGDVQDTASSIGTVDDENDNGSDYETKMSHPTTVFTAHNKNESTMPNPIDVPFVKGPSVKVMVTHIRSPNDFMVQLSSNKNKLQTLSHNMNIWCKTLTASKDIPLLVEKDELVLAQYSKDKRWYRARVLNILLRSDESGDKTSKIHVQFIDFGNEEYVTIKEIRNKQDRFFRYPEFCLHCSLYNIAPFSEHHVWDADVVHEFWKMTENKVLLMNAIEKNGQILDVDLVVMPAENVSGDNFVSIRDVLIFLELARFRFHSNAATAVFGPPAYVKTEFLKPTPVSTGKVIGVVVTSVTSPSDFYVMALGDEHSYYLSMLEEMQNTYNKDTCNLYALYYPKSDTVCAVRGDDGKWYRAKVVAPPKHRQVTVSLVDIGDTHIVNFDRLKKLHTSFLKLPEQAIRCKLSHISACAEGPDDWSDTAELWARNILLGSTCSALIVRWASIKEVVLWQGQEREISVQGSLNAALIATGLGKNCGLSSITLPQEFGATSDSLKPAPFYNGNFEKRHSSPSGSSEASSATIPSPKKKEGLQKNIPKNKTRASSRASSSSEEQSIGKQPAKQKSKKTMKVYKDSPKTGTTMKEKKPNVPRNNQEHVNTTSTQSPQKSANDVKYIPIVISSYTSPSDFYIRFEEKEEDLKMLMRDMQQYYTSLPAEKKPWSGEQYCAAKYSVDGEWYRAKVIKVDSTKEITVVMVDYGFMEVTTELNLKQLTRELGNRMEILAVRCHLADVMPAGSSSLHKWSCTGVEFMANRTRDRKLYVKREGEMTDMGLPIDIIVEEEIPETAFDPVTHTYHSLRQLIKDQGLAMPCKDNSLPSPTDEKGDPFGKKIFEQSASELTDPCSGTDRMKDITRSGFMKLPPCPLPKLESSMLVVPTSVDMEGVIYVQPSDWGKDIEELSMELQSTYQNDGGCPNTDWTEGSLCAALFPEDNLWYRASILQKKGNEVRVFYLDFGNSTWVTRDQVRELLPQFLQIHPLAYCCVLVDLVPKTSQGDWPVEVLDLIHQLVVNAFCTLKTEGINEEFVLEVSLYTQNGLDLHSYLAKEGFALDFGDLSINYMHSASVGRVLVNANPYTQQELRQVGDTFKAITTAVELPNVLYVQRVKLSDSDVTDFVLSSEIAELNSTIDAFEELSYEMKSTESKMFLGLPDVGTMCLGQYSGDGQWYRGLCVEKYQETDCCLVVYVDYGSVEITPSKNMRQLPPQFWHFPAQAYRCYLNIMPPDGNLWRRKSLHATVKALCEKEVIVRVMQLSPLTVELLVEEDGELKLAYNELIEEGYALMPSAALAGNTNGEDKDADVVIESDSEVECMPEEQAPVCSALADMAHLKEIIERVEKEASSDEEEWETDEEDVDDEEKKEEFTEVAEDIKEFEQLDRNEDKETGDPKGQDTMDSTSNCSA